MLLIILESIIHCLKQFIVVISSYIEITTCQHVLLEGGKENKSEVNKQSLILELVFQCCLFPRYLVIKYDEMAQAFSYGFCYGKIKEKGPSKRKVYFRM